MEKSFRIVLLNVLVAMCSGVCVLLLGCGSEAETHTHTLTYYPSVAATCEVGGSIAYYQCDECGAKFTDTTASEQLTQTQTSALGHKFNTEQTPPSCSDKGVLIFTCSACGLKLTEDIPPIAHEYTATLHPPTCTEKGFTEHICKYCQDRYTDTETPALNHDLHTETVPSTCTKKGKETRTCSRCDYIEEKELDLLEHEYAEIVHSPTCTDKGYTEHKCKTCDDSYTDSETPALGHDYIIKTEHPTCTKTGKETKTCSRCNRIEEKELPTVEHEYKETVHSPTCTENGYTEHICKFCKDSYTDTETPALGHDFNDSGKCSRCEQLAEWEYLLKYELTDGGYKIVGIAIRSDVAEVALVIPATYEGHDVIEIADNAFANEQKLKSVVIPKSIYRIGEGAFKDSGLEEAEFEKTSGWRKGNMVHTWGSIEQNAKTLTQATDAFVNKS